MAMLDRAICVDGNDDDGEGGCCNWLQIDVGVAAAKRKAKEGMTSLRDTYSGDGECNEQLRPVGCANGCKLYDARWLEMFVVPICFFSQIFFFSQLGL